MGRVIFSSWAGSVVGSPESEEPLAEIQGLDFPEAFEDGRKVKAFMGWNGIILRDPSVSMVDMAREYMKRAQQESCGQCIPCRMGTRVLLEILERICRGEGEVSDLEGCRAFIPAISLSPTWRFRQSLKRPGA